MKIFLKILKWTTIVLLLIICVFFAFVFSQQSKVYDAPYPNITAVKDSLVLERGKYLIYGPAHCSGCHSPLENLEAITAGEHAPLEGGLLFDLPIAKIYTPNITSDETTGIGKHTDQQIARALRYGVGHDGKALFDFMPFHNLSDDDLQAIISYLRTMQPVRKEIPKNEYTLLGKIVYAMAIRPVGPEAGVPVEKSVIRDSTAKYGQYLANYVANCRGCHSNRDLQTGAYIGEYYAGGFAMPSMIQPGKAVVSPNLTTDPKTGKIANWTEQKFIERIRQGKIVPLSEMPWSQFQQMSDSDLKAIYAYLKTLDPVHNEVNQVVIDMK